MLCPNNLYSEDVLLKAAHRSLRGSLAKMPPDFDATVKQLLDKLGVNGTLEFQENLRLSSTAVNSKIQTPLLYENAS